MRIVSYNICHGKFAALNLTTLGQAIAALNADLAGIQEVDQFTQRANNQDSTALLAEGAALPYSRFTAALPYQGGEYGTAQLSRYPILSFTPHPLPSGTAEPRAFGHTVIDLNGIPVHFINTHLSLGGAENRTAQFAEIARVLPTDAPYIITGDFNTTDSSEFAHLCALSVNDGPRRMGSYYPADSNIDHILLSPHWKLNGWGMAESTLSDHNAIWADISL